METRRLEGIGTREKLKVAEDYSFFDLHDGADSDPARRKRSTGETSRKADAVDRERHYCPYINCIANVTGCCTQAKTPRVGSKWYESSEQKTQTIPRNRMIFHPKDWGEFVPIICKGWASYSVIEADGRRQILSFRLPGDIMLWQPMPGRMVEAITEVTYRRFERKKFMEMLRDSTGLWQKLLDVLSNDLDRAERIAYSLGQLRADERVARLIVALSERLASRGLMQGQRMEFPLRHRDIANATGLTRDHVGKVLGGLQRASLIKISGQSLTIVDQLELRNRAKRPLY